LETARRRGRRRRAEQEMGEYAAEMPSHSSAFPFPAVGGQHIEPKRKPEVAIRFSDHGSWLVSQAQEETYPSASLPAGCRYKLLPSCSPNLHIAFSASVPVLCSVLSTPFLCSAVPAFAKVTHRLVSSRLVRIASTMQCRSLCSRIVHAFGWGGTPYVC
jgi:hypothetical protein